MLIKFCRQILIPLLVILVISSGFSLLTPLISAHTPVLSTQKTSDMQGVEMDAYSDEGKRIHLKILDQEIDPKDPKEEVYLYTIYTQDSNRHWQNLCHGDANFPAKALVLQGSWNVKGQYQSDQKLVTVSCANQALGKCVRFGYKPWGKFNNQPLRDYHQACLRLVRADYCGDGVGHTKDGTPINIYDRLGIQKPDVVTNMSFEAAWNPDGAICINHVRWPEDLAYVQHVCPSKLLNHKHCSTGSQAQANFPKALLFNDSVVRNH